LASRHEAAGERGSRETRFNGFDQKMHPRGEKAVHSGSAAKRMIVGKGGDRKKEHPGRKKTTVDAVACEGHREFQSYQARKIQLSSTEQIVNHAKLRSSGWYRQGHPEKKADPTTGKKEKNMD